MKRVVSISLALIVILTVLAIGQPSRRGDAQDQTDTRLAALETQVAGNTADISSLRKRVRTLEDAAKTAEIGEGDGGQKTTSAGAITVSGIGVTVSEKFHLDAARYKVSASVDVADYSGFIVHLYGGGGYEEYLFNELIDHGGPWTASTVVTINRAGDYFVGVENTTDPWSLTFEQF